MVMMDFLKRCFEENYIVDDREPLATFQIPHVEGDFSLFAPSLGPWTQQLFFSFLQSIIQIVFACFIYEAIVKRRGTIGSYIIGWGFVIPMSIYLPFYLLEVLDLRNKVLCLGSSIVMSVIFFRCIEAMYGTSPDVVELSISNYCGYYSSLMPYVWSSKTKRREKPTGAQLLRIFMERMFNFLACSLVLSIMIHYDYKPFEDTVEWTKLTVTKDLLSLGHLKNSYAIIFLIYFTLNNMFELNAFQENVKGFATEPLFDAPLTRSKTPTEFWTKRWNRMTHRLLQGGIFKPLILCLDDKRVPMFLTFVASGLYHDYVWFTTFYMQKCLYDENGVCSNEANCYDLKFGRVTAFFAYTGIVMLLERPMMKLAPVQWLSAHLPTLVIAQLMVCLHTPVVKWYGGAWIEGGLFDDLSIMLFLVRKG